MVCHIDWYRSRPKSHYRITQTAITLRGDALCLPKGDVDKVARGILDGLTDVWFTDDTLVKRLEVEKHWVPFGQPEFVRITVSLYAGPPDIVADLNLAGAIDRVRQLGPGDTLSPLDMDALEMLAVAIMPG